MYNRREVRAHLDKSFLILKIKEFKGFAEIFFNISTEVTNNCIGE